MADRLQQEDCMEIEQSETTQHAHTGASGTHHNLAEGADAEDLVNLIRLLLLK